MAIKAAKEAKKAVESLMVNIEGWNHAWTTWKICGSSDPEEGLSDLWRGCLCLLVIIYANEPTLTLFLSSGVTFQGPYLQSFSDSPSER